VCPGNVSLVGAVKSVRLCEHDQVVVQRSPALKDFEIGEYRPSILLNTTKHDGQRVCFVIMRLLSQRSFSISYSFEYSTERVFRDSQGIPDAF
jgi:hypothetical protein